MSRHYVIVGGSHGIGLEVVRKLSRENHVLVLSRSNDSLAGLANVNHIPFDATTDDLDASLLPESLNGLAYCPGTITLKSLRGLTPEQLRTDFEVNVVGAVRVIQAMSPLLKKSAGEATSSIVLFSSVAVGQGLPMHCSIAASKGAIEGLTRTLAAELSPQIRINCVAPALTKTKLTEKFFSDDKKSAALAEKYPLRRTGRPEDVASLATFLLTQESDWITGQVMGVDGGMAATRK